MLEYFDRNFHEKAKADGTLAAKARAISTDADQYIHNLIIFTNYKADLLKNQADTESINECVRLTGIDKYLGSHLYGITDKRTLNEGVRALKKMHSLKTRFGVAKYKNEPVENYSEYDIEGLLVKCREGNFEGCEIDESLIEKDENTVHELMVKPAADKIESFLAKKKYGKLAAKMSSMVGKGDERPVVEDFYAYSLLCKELLLLLTDSEFSKRLPKSMRKKAGKKLDKMVTFFESISESEVVQAEMDLRYIGLTGTTDEDVHNVLKDYE